MKNYKFCQQRLISSPTLEDKKSNKYPVKLRVINDLIAGYYQTIIDLEKDEFDKLAASRISNELQSIRDKLKDIERKTQNAASAFSPFNFADFENDFIHNNTLSRQRKSKPLLQLACKNEFDDSLFHKKIHILLEDYSTPGTVFFSYLNFINKVLREDRIGSAMYYHCSYVSLKKFRGNVRF